MKVLMKIGTLCALIALAIPVPAAQAAAPAVAPTRAADTTDTATATNVIGNFYKQLVDVMQHGDQLGFT
ncbi:MAG: hypothetical protein M3N08_07795, partial [Pseudomonadota bacterium]|nr:hypothetical protein [Pseudomonadota bacterium]